MITAKKSLGQNFLKDENIIHNIITSSNINDDDLIIEIGPGPGALTKYLSKLNVQVIAFEIDERMHENLDALENETTKVIYKDILKVNLAEELKGYKYNKLKVIANLPYYITSPIIEMFITSNIKIDEIIVMVQKEVADRFAAVPCSKDYGFMTVFININYDVEKLFNVKNTCFVPAPKVDSAVIKLTRKKEQVKDISYIKNFIGCSFSHKRKTLKNNLTKDVWEQVLPILISKGYSESVRAEEISVDDYIDICNKLKH